MSLFELRRENYIQLPEMRRWQKDAVQHIREAIVQGHKHFVVQAATGAGKTQLAANLFAGSLNKGKRPVFIVPDISLVEQTLQSFNHVGIHDIGIMQGNHRRTDHRAQVQIASLKTLVRRQLPDADLIIVDEVHVQNAQLLAILEEEWKDKVVIGLSATPWAKGMGLHWTKLIHGLTIREGIEDGILCPFTIFGAVVKPNRAGVKTVAGEWDDATAGAAMSEQKIVASVVETWRKLWGGHETFMFCQNRAHAKEQQEAFNQAGIPFGYIDGTMSIEERLPVLEAYDKHEIYGISSVGCLIRGVDKRVRYVIDAQMTKSDMSLVQKIGRGLRIAPGKDYLIIADHAMNQVNRTFDQIHHDELDSRDPKEKGEAYAGEKLPAKPHECPSCHAMVPYGQKCACGFVFVKTSDIEHIPGELYELTGGAGAKVTKAKKKEPTPEDKRRWYAELLGYAEQHGKSTSWALANFHEKFKSWPHGKNSITPEMPSPEVFRYVRGRRIAWAKSQKREKMSA